MTERRLISSLSLSLEFETGDETFLKLLKLKFIITLLRNYYNSRTLINKHETKILVT